MTALEASDASGAWHMALDLLYGLARNHPVLEEFTNDTGVVVDDEDEDGRDNDDDDEDSDDDDDDDDDDGGGDDDDDDK